MPTYRIYRTIAIHTDIWNEIKLGKNIHSMTWHEIRTR